ncbi:MAG: histidinol dehydrogenase, partial [Anaerolineae bacterium]|nr:histidinol dehydrogenase [Anaerolineae bacterium]
MDVPPRLLDGIEAIFGQRITPDEAVRRILADVRGRGDDSLREWTLRIDGVALDAMAVSPAQIAAAYEQLPGQVVDALRLAAQRVEAFHRRQPAVSWIHNDEQGTLGQLVRPIQRVGAYIPGGTAPLPSTVLMTAIPARVAGVEHVAVITPPRRATGLPHPAILVAADIAGVNAVYIGGGA